MLHFHRVFTEIIDKIFYKTNIFLNFANYLLKDEDKIGYFKANSESKELFIFKFYANEVI